MAEKLTGDQRNAALAPLSGWSDVEGRDAIHKQFVFKNFHKAFAFMTQCAIQAEKIDHHPEWSNVYNKVDVILTTHDVDGLSPLDIKLAGYMDRAAHSFV